MMPWLDKWRVDCAEVQPQKPTRPSVAHSAEQLSSRTPFMILSRSLLFSIPKQGQIIARGLDSRHFICNGRSYLWSTAYPPIYSRCPVQSHGKHCDFISCCIYLGIEGHQTQLKSAQWSGLIVFDLIAFASDLLTFCTFLCYKGKSIPCSHSWW